MSAQKELIEERMVLGIVHLARYPLLDTLSASWRRTRNVELARMLDDCDGDFARRVPDRGDAWGGRSRGLGWG